MRHLWIIAFVLACLLVLAPPAAAGPVWPEPVVLVQPDGTTLVAIPYGDEWNNGHETLDGYTIVQDAATGAWSYAVAGGDGQLAPSRVAPGSAPPPALAPHLRGALHGPARIVVSPQEHAALAGATGVQPVVVLLVSFSDRGPVGSTPAQWSAQFFHSTNSAQDFYRQASYGLLTLLPAAESHGVANDGVVGWLNLGRPHPNTAGSTGIANLQLARDAIMAADPYINFGGYDANRDGYISTSELHVVVIAAGYETSYGSANACAPSVWGHQWALGGYIAAPLVDGVSVAAAGYGGYTQFGEWHCRTSAPPGHMATMGIMVHELGHDIDWPDLYDIDNSSSGVGYWSIMGSGSWRYVWPGEAGSTPALPDAFLKWYQGWLTPQHVTGTAAGVTLAQAETSPRAVQILNNPNGVDWAFGLHPGSGEYFLLENRQLVGYDAGLPGCGILVWHIDETRTSSNSANASDSRRLVSLEEADGMGDLNRRPNSGDPRANAGDAGDPYPGSANNGAFNDASNPNSRLYSGAASGVSLGGFSACGDAMSVNIVAPAGPATGTPTPSPTRPLTVTPSRTATPSLTATPPGPSRTPTTSPTTTLTPSPTRTVTPSATWTRFPTRTPGGPWFRFFLPLILIAPAEPTPTPSRTPTLTATPPRTTTPTTTATVTGWVTVLYEGFEGAFPAGWQVLDENTTDGEHTWAKRACRAASGGYSGWAVGGGRDGAALACGSTYPNNASSVMIYGPFSLADAVQARISFKSWVNVEYWWDKVWAEFSSDGGNWFSVYTSGPGDAWTDNAWDLAALGLAGQPRVWIRFRFYSDNSVALSEGVYLDDIHVQKCSAGCTPLPAPLSEPAAWRAAP